MCADSGALDLGGMMDDALASALHDRATRGEKLSAQQQDLLDAWYDQRDAVENALLSCTSARHSLGIDELKREIDTALARVAAATGHVQRLTRQNAELRRSVVELQRRLASPSHAA
jgi:chromosome segregation ATPase